jgi:hypothetical protein
VVAGTSEEKSEEVLKCCWGITLARYITAQHEVTMLDDDDIRSVNEVRIAQNPIFSNKST